MNRAFHRNASKLRRQLGTDSRPVIDCTGAKRQLLNKLAQMRAAMAEQDERYKDPEYSPYTPEEAERIMSNVKERLNAGIAEKEALRACTQLQYCTPRHCAEQGRQSAQ